eukprot:TRINITY_DN34402_c0_g2_i1.p1 TRINITY_DN34402_c0_g2~~TRINITY_DN34402_c0_g2_i1.p1  ORF type:complete len:1129 (+),score=122.26 TRINITY_DN34402_c0_g2_i1:444-3389(+)
MMMQQFRLEWDALMLTVAPDKRVRISTGHLLGRGHPPLQHLVPNPTASTPNTPVATAAANSILSPLSISNSSSGSSNPNSPAPHPQPVFSTSTPVWKQKEHKENTSSETSNSPNTKVGTSQTQSPGYSSSPSQSQPLPQPLYASVPSAEAIVNGSLTVQTNPATQSPSPLHSSPASGAQSNGSGSISRTHVQQGNTPTETTQLSHPISVMANARSSAVSTNGGAGNGPPPAKRSLRMDPLQTDPVLNLQRRELDAERNRIEQQLKDLAKIVEFQEREHHRQADREQLIDRHKARAIEHERDILLDRERRLQQSHDRQRAELEMSREHESSLAQELIRMLQVEKQRKIEMQDLKLMEDQKERELKDLKTKVDELQATVESTRAAQQAAELRASQAQQAQVHAQAAVVAAGLKDANNASLTSINTRLNSMSSFHQQQQAQTTNQSSSTSATNARATALPPSSTVNSTLSTAPEIVEPQTLPTFTPSPSRHASFAETLTFTPSLNDVLDVQTQPPQPPSTHPTKEAVQLGRTGSIPGMGPPTTTSTPVRSAAPSRSGSLYSVSATTTSSNRERWEKYNDVLLAMDDQGELDDEDLKLGLFQLTPRTATSRPPDETDHDNVMKNRDKVLDLVSSENEMLENCIQVAEDLVKGQKEMENTLLQDHKWMIKKRITNAYEVAARIGIESTALKQAGVTEERYTLVAPNKVVKSEEAKALKAKAITIRGKELDSPEPTQQSPEKMIGTAATTSNKRFKNLAKRALMAKRFVKGTQDDVSAAQRFKQAHEQLMKSQGFVVDQASVNVGASPKTKRKTKFDQRRFINKEEYAQLFKEQEEMNEFRKKHDVMYEKMLNSYLENQRKLFAKIAKDPWELSPNDFYNDKTELRLKKQLGEIIGLSDLGAQTPSRSNSVAFSTDGEDYTAADKVMFMSKEEAAKTNTGLRLEMAVQELVGYADEEPSKTPTHRSQSARSISSAASSTGPPSLVPL